MRQINDRYEATYRSSDGSLYVNFLFKNESSRTGWRIYIVSEIDWRGRDTSSTATHRIFASPHDYICWNSAIKTLEGAEAVAALWADTVALYVQGFGTFDNIARILSARAKRR